MGERRVVGIALALLCANSAAAQEQVRYQFHAVQRQPLASGGGVEIAYETGAPWSRGGYHLLRIFLESRSRQVEPVQLAFLPSGGPRYVRSVALEPGERRTVLLPIPTALNYGRLEASGPAFAAPAINSVGFSALPTHAVLALGDAEAFQRLAGVAPDHSGVATEGVMLLAPQEAPDELSAYTGFDLVVVTGDPLESLTEPQRRALEAYAATGGALVVGRPGRMVASALPLLPAHSPGRHPYGFGSVRLCDSSENSCGGLLANALTEATRETPVQPVDFDREWKLKARYGSKPSGELMLPQAIAPMGSFLLIIIAFTLAIGPGSLYVARRRGPPALLVSIPATAAVTCVAIIGYSIIRDGFTVHGATRGFTLLDGANKRAITVGVGAFYANLAPRKAEFTSATSVVLGPSTGGEALASIDFTQGIRFGSDFLPSRRYREWGVLAVEPSRARLAIRRDDEGLWIQNALGSHLRAAHVKLEGKMWRVSEVPDGAERRAALLESAHPLPSVEVNEFSSRFRGDLPAVAKAELGEGEFLAHVEGPSLLPLGGVRFRSHSSEHLIRGEVE